LVWVPRGREFVFAEEEVVIFMVWSLWIPSS